LSITITQLYGTCDTTHVVFKLFNL
jgi:hypothetical protein